MRKTVFSVLDAVAGRLGDEVTHSFKTDIEALPDRKLGYDYDSYFLAFRPFEEIKEHLSEQFIIELIHENKWVVDENKAFKMQLVYERFDFINAQVEELITKYEGLACCYDKSSTLIRMYIHYLATNELPNVTKGDKEFWKPSHGTAEEWMNFIDSTIQLYEGLPEAYMKAYQKLVSVYELIVEEKRKHNEQVLTAAPQFTEKRQAGESMEYDFEGEQGMTATVIVDAQQHSKYRYYEKGMEGMSRKERFRMERKPWFMELLKELH